MVQMRQTMLLEVFLLLILGSSANAAQCTVELADNRALDNNAETLCDSNNCFWIAATEQDGTATGRCYQCSQQQSQEDCLFTNVCFWVEGRDELGGIDCTLCAGRNQGECESVSYCFWDVEGFEGVCSKCPGHQDSNSCAAGGCFWRKIQGVEKCVKCGGYQTQENCEATGCKWNDDPDANVKCGGNSDIFLLPPPLVGDEDTSPSSAISRVWHGSHTFSFGVVGLLTFLVVLLV